MDDATVIMVMLALGIGLILVEVFIPSYGMLTIASIGCLFYAVYRAYGISDTVGHSTLIGSVIGVPLIFTFGFKYFYKSSWSHRLIPENPSADAHDFAPAHAALSELVGTTGKVLTPLRPAGICEFNGKRINCKSQFGLIERNQTVRAMAVHGNELVVEAEDAS